MSSTTLNGASEVFTSTAGVNGNPPPAATTQQSTSSPEEIGWYFVESYYTTLNRTPERLHLFHQKQSSFVWGLEGENVAVSHGRNEIHERIKQLAFNDCKVRVTNVDSQGSLHSGIIVQVLGDMINNSGASQRFAQTFFLAEQTNPQGYYVLNDIFRYIKEEEEEEVAETAPEETAEAPAEAEAEPVAVEEKEPEVEAKEAPEAPEPAPLPEKEEVKEEVKEEIKEETVKVDEAPVEPEPEKVEEPAAVVPVTPAVPVVPAVPAVPVIPAPQPEATEPEPTPEPAVAVTEPVKETPQAPPPVPQEAPKPVKPASWAALLAPKSTPAAPTAPVATQPVAPAAATTTGPTATTTAPAPSAPATAPGPSSQASSGWQTHEPRRQNRPVSMSGAPQNAGSAYVRGVNEKVTQRDLKAALEKFGTVNSVEIALERKCAFVEFGDGAALLAAAKENPHSVGGAMVYVEERRPRVSNYGGPRGGGSNLRGGERQGSRGGSQRGPGDRDRFDNNRNSIGGGRGQGGNVRGGGQYPRGGRGGAAASSN